MITARNTEGLEAARTNLVLYGYAIVEYEPGNGTRYVLVLVRTVDPYAEPPSRNPKELYVGWLGHGCYVFQHYAHWAYVADKLDKVYSGSEADYKPIADLINYMLGIDE